MQSLAKMLLFDVLTIIMLLWNLYLNNRVRIMRNEVGRLEADIEGAVASCGRSMN